MEHILSFASNCLDKEREWLDEGHTGLWEWEWTIGSLIVSHVFTSQDQLKSVSQQARPDSERLRCKFDEVDELWSCSGKSFHSQMLATYERVESYLLLHPVTGNSVKQSMWRDRKAPRKDSCKMQVPSQNDNQESRMYVEM